MKQEGELDKKLLEAATNGDFESVQTLLDTGARVDCLDEYGSTPLQLACFKGRLDIARVLLARGANVNSNEHEHGYTALMFAALSGNAELCHTLLEAGAKSYSTNRLGKSASEMAAFTGQHQCVSVINNFFDPDEIDYYTVCHGSEKEARLTKDVASTLYLLLKCSNVHPVKVIFFLVDHAETLSPFHKQVLYVLEELVEKQMKQKETNEIMALKLHVVFASVKIAFKYVQEERKSANAAAKELSEKDALLLFAKSLLATKEANYPHDLEMLLRQSIKEFPYKNCVLLQQLIRTLASTAPGDSPTSMSAINQLLFGHMFLADRTFCVTCGDANPSKRCGACRVASYCSERCQKLHWFAHKKWCALMAREAAAKAAMALHASQEGESIAAAVADATLNEVAAVHQG